MSISWLVAILVIEQVRLSNTLFQLSLSIVANNDMQIMPPQVVAVVVAVDRSSSPTTTDSTNFPCSLISLFANTILSSFARES